MNFKTRIYLLFIDRCTNCTYSRAIESNVAPKQNEVTKRMPADTLQGNKKKSLIRIVFRLLIIIIVRYLF